jgi:hypothetical protein
MLLIADVARCIVCYAVHQKASYLLILYMYVFLICYVCTTYVYMYVIGLITMLLCTFQVICDINVQIATFRDLLIHVGTAKDAPELREKIRRVRRQCVEACKQTNTQLMPQIKRYIPQLSSEKMSGARQLSSYNVL